MFRAPKVPGYDAAAFETKQVFYPSKDGTTIPMFLVYRKGLKLDGNNPTLLYGYGGFNIVLSPTFSAARIALLEQGFVYASANLRGGGEYGESWHRAGDRSSRSRTSSTTSSRRPSGSSTNKYTSTARSSRSRAARNGGLLVGAVMNQRPELFRVAIPEVGVMDMLRFHKFTIGWNWIADYGSSDNAGRVQGALRLLAAAQHQARRDVPGDADHDRRPRRPRRAGALVQVRRDAAGAREAATTPVLIRIETKSGHGASSLTKQLETTADIYAFVMYNVGAKVQRSSVGSRRSLVTVGSHSR